MFRWLVALVLVASSATAIAQAPAILIEACSLLDTASRRVECLAAAGAGRASSQDQTGWEGLKRAQTQLHGTLSTSITYRQYQDLLLELQKHFSLVNADSSPRFATARDSASLMLAAYIDAGRFWSEDIEFYSRRDNRSAYAGGLPMKMVGLEWMVDKYNLPTRKSDIWGINQGVQRSAGLDSMWGQANQLAVATWGHVSEAAAVKPVVDPTK